MRCTNRNGARDGVSGIVQTCTTLFSPEKMIVQVCIMAKITIFRPEFKNILTMKRLLGVLSVACLALQAPVWAQQNINQEKQVITSPVVKGDKTVTFTLRAPNANEVLISGDWMQGQRFAPMQRGTDGVWAYTTEVLPSDVYIYSYLVDGTRIIDPSTVFQCRDVNSLFSMFYIDGEYGDYYQVQNVPHGNVSRVWYHSDRLKADRRMTIYTPAGYEESKASYPVLYLLHGSGGDEEAWITLGSVARIMDNLIAEGKVQPMIVVMPNGNPSKQAAPGETSDNLAYTPAMSNTFVGYKDGSYEQSFSEIINYVETHYRVKADKAHRAIAGLSMGGFHTLQISANYPMFDYVGLFSPGISGLADYKVELYENLDEKLTKLKQAGIKLYWIGIGKDDFLYKDVEAYRKKLDSLAFPYVYKETDKGHVWTNWRKYLMEFLQLIK